ncbi:MAG: BatA domain-containing protein [Bacteroidia bacterium]|nr:BatA domain-containing protein [Bacteroidia bacterium]
MHFQQPNMLWGLLLLAIPLLIHLFQFHKTKTIYFPGVFRLTQRLQQARQQKRLEHWLVLIARMLGLACMVFAFSMPSCSEDGGATKGHSHIVILIDNGFSMSVDGDKGPLIEQAKSQARVILSDLPEGTQVKLLTQTQQSELWLSPSQALGVLDTLSVGLQKFTLKDWVERVQLLQQEAGVRSLGAIVFSEMQSAFFSGMLPQSSDDQIDWRLVHLDLDAAETTVGNLSLDTAWYVSQFSSDSKSEGLVVKAKVSHRGGSISEAKLKLISEGKTLFAQTKTIKAGETLEFESVVSQSNMEKPMVLVLGEDGYRYDNQLHLHPVKTWQTTVGVIGMDRALDALFAAQPLLKKRSVSALDIQNNALNGMGLDALVCVGPVKLSKVGVERLLSSIEAGMVFLQFTPSASNAPWDVLKQQYVDGTWKRLDERMASAGLSHPLFQGIFSEQLSDKVNMPAFSSVFVGEAMGDAESVLQLEGGQSLLLSQRIESGSQWFWLSDLNEGSKQFLNSGWFLPVVTQVFASSTAQEKPLYGVLFSKQMMSLPAPIATDERAVQLQGMGRSAMVEVQTNAQQQASIYLGAEPSAPGHYRLVSPLEKSPITLAFNWPRLESNLTSDPNWKLVLAQTQMHWNSSEGDGKSSILENEPLKVLWRLFIWGAAIFFAVEVLLLLRRTNIKTQEP